MLFSCIVVNYMIMNEGKNLSTFFLKARLNFQHTTSTFANGKVVKLTVSSLREINLLVQRCLTGTGCAYFWTVTDTQQGTVGNVWCGDTRFVLWGNLGRTMGSGFESDQSGWDTQWLGPWLKTLLEHLKRTQMWVCTRPSWKLFRDPRVPRTSPSPSQWPVPRKGKSQTGAHGRHLARHSWRNLN